MNIVLIIIDTLRKDHVGAYGNDWIITPHLDAFAAESVVFTRAYPDSLPTLPVRRALHTGMRTFPFHGHRDYKGDFSGAPGWGPIPEEQDTISEILGARGYRSAFITDCYHQFKPSKNFHRGFSEWIWVRGQEHDPYRSGPRVQEQRVGAHMNRTVEDDPVMAEFLWKYLDNNAYRMNEGDYYPARVFNEAARWLWDNHDAENFLLLVDSFDPHEPWDPPVYYRKLYDPNEDCADVIQSPYAPWKESFSPRELKRIQANYAGEVTMVDRWFGYFFETLQRSGRLEDTVVAVISDHGHNLGYDPGDKGLVSKQGHPMTKAVADLVLMVRHPKGQGAGTTCDKLVYDHDLTATLMHMVGTDTKQKMDGRDFWPAVMNNKVAFREHVTVAWGPLMTVIGGKWWYNATIWGEGEILNDLDKDPALETNVAESYPNVCKEMLRRAVEDAGGSIPDSFNDYKGKPGCTPYKAAGKATKLEDIKKLPV
jgi:arylsulfatase A-like enzyme